MPPLLISDGRSMGLVDDRARLVWLCAPRVDQPAICAALIDPERGGAVEVLIEDAEPAGQRHQEGTLVVETDLRSPAGMVRIIDALFVPPRGPVAPAEPGLFIRQMVVLEGEVRIGVRVDPRYGFGRDVPRWRREGRATLGFGPGLTVELQCEIPVRPTGSGLAGATTLPAGQRRVLALRWQDPKGVGTDLRKMTDDTAAWWRAWAGQGDGDPRAVLLKGLVHHPTGAVVRAATTSLVEPPEDGRLAWLEDQDRAGAAFRAMGHHAEADRVDAWREAAGPGGPVRGLGGEEPLPATVATHLSRPVSVGRPEGDARGNLPYLPDLLREP